MRLYSNTAIIKLLFARMRREDGCEGIVIISLNNKPWKCPGRTTVQRPIGPIPAKSSTPNVLRLYISTTAGPTGDEDGGKRKRDKIASREGPSLTDSGRSETN